ncbi:AAA family ATPase [Flagellimonas pacifica]|uniref:Predicted ATPase, AAA+ ATPase superfamily n=1 Tax=Flagellimonas pacifica TaxID=1247520 RepID=A0A285MWP2_9FLAO|nr:ATP-binding protein [Allomuricauda parva]SNZ01619.1 Predicted ATPase, AAA+ ATPase superfamily [Allomuricauda parva]
MSNRYNPFKPNYPIYSGLFAGRFKEMERIDDALFQTAHNNPTNLLFVGERGIGKTSLLLLTKYFANGTIVLDKKKHNFLTIQLNINSNTTIADFIIKFKKQLQRELHKMNSTQKVIDKAWGFVKRLEISGFKINDTPETSTEQLIDDFTYSFSETIEELTNGEEVSKDGIVVIIDEADTACKELGLGAFLKSLTETLVSENTNRALFVLAGLPTVTDILRESHQSSLRLFEEHLLKPLKKKDVKFVIDRAIEEVNEKEQMEIKIVDGAIEKFHEVSEGYPHFLQQIGFCVIVNLKSNQITPGIVEDSMYQQGGALDLIGKRYYMDLYYNKIKVDSYRQILSIMAKEWDQWISKTEIRKDFKGSGTELNNGIKALRDRNIILTKRGVRGVYRLQWLSFAFWIRIHKLRG